MTKPPSYSPSSYEGKPDPQRIAHLRQVLQARKMREISRLHYVLQSPVARLQQVLRNRITQMYKDLTVCIAETVINVGVVLGETVIYDKRVKVEIGKAMLKISDILELGEGSIIELSKKSSEPADVYADNILSARGTAAVADHGFFAVKITEIISSPSIFSLGSVIVLDRKTTDPADIYVNDVLFAKGEIVVIEENFGVRINQIIT